MLEGLTSRGHAIECLLCAENPDRMFLPSPGRITRLVLPQAVGLRIDCGVREGDVVSSFYDSLLAKVIVHAEDRPAAIAAMRAALAGITVQGIVTNIEFLRRVFDHVAFAEGRTLTAFIETHRATLFP